MYSRVIWFLAGILLGGLALGFLLLRSPRSPAWPDLLPSVRADLQERLGFVPQRVWIEDTLDLTGDGVKEALVAYQAGAAVEEVAVYGVRKGRPVLLFRKREGHEEPMILRRGAGGAGRYGFDFWFSPEGAVVQGGFQVEGTPRDSCGAVAFGWEKDHFVEEPVLTARESERYCRKVCLELKKTPFRDLAAPLCSGLD